MRRRTKETKKRLKGGSSIFRGGKLKAKEELNSGVVREKECSQSYTKRWSRKRPERLGTAGDP